LKVTEIPQAVPQLVYTARQQYMVKWLGSLSKSLVAAGYV